MATYRCQDILPGDTIRVRMGDLIPADIRIVEGQLLLDQSALTGKPLPTRERFRTGSSACDLHARHSVRFNGSRRKWCPGHPAIGYRGGRYDGHSVERLASSNAQFWKHDQECLALSRFTHECDYVIRVE